MKSLKKYNEHIHYLTDEDDADYNPDEIIELVGMPSGMYFTITRKEFKPKLKEFVNWSVNLQMYVYRDKDYSKVMYILDKELSTVNSNDYTYLENWGITDFLISKNKVFVDGNVIIKSETFTKLPFEFEEVSGDFTVIFSNLQTLENCPKIVDGNFIVKQNKLKTLDGGPIYIGKDYDCSSNYLTTLKGSPQKVRNFNCCNNNLKTLKGCPMYIEGDFNCSHNYLSTLKDGPISCKGTFDFQDNIVNSLDGIPFHVKSIISKNNPIQSK